MTRQPCATTIAEALEARPNGSGRWMALCPAHEERTPSFSIRETETGKVLVHCFGGCSQDEVLDALRNLGLWPQPNQQLSRRHGPTLAELEREAIRHLIAGTLPNRLPPYTRHLPRHGDVFILIGHRDWPRRSVPALVLPPGHPPAAYKWPVAGRRVKLIDLAEPESPGYFHYGETPWLADPWQWAAVRRDWLKAFAVELIASWSAEHVRVVSEAGKATYRREVRNAA